MNESTTYFVECEYSWRNCGVLSSMCSMVVANPPFIKLETNGQSQECYALILSRTCGWFCLNIRPRPNFGSF